MDNKPVVYCIEQKTGIGWFPIGGAIFLDDDAAIVELRRVVGDADPELFRIAEYQRRED